VSSHPAGDPCRNVELKAWDRDPARALAVCRGLGAADRGVLVQRDTYFVVPRGRLKLREESPPSRAELVQYERPDDADARVSRYRLVPIADADALREALAAALGVWVVVEKERHLFLWEGVRIHLDDVRGLGRLLEFEAVAAAGSDLAAETARVARLREAFALRDEDLVPTSYSALLLARAPK
jgi:adenylate cyclase class IV